MLFSNPLYAIFLALWPWQPRARAAKEAKACVEKASLLSHACNMMPGDSTFIIIEQLRTTFPAGRVPAGFVQADQLSLHKPVRRQF